MSSLETFFNGHPFEWGLFCELEMAVREIVPEMNIRVMKSCISLDDVRPFCYVSLQRCGKRSGPYILISFGIDAPIADPRIAAAVEPYPNRWTHHVPVGDPSEIDEQLLAWISWAHSLSKKKRRKG